MTVLRGFLMLVPIACVAGCGQPDTGFTLPKGDAARGEAAFVSYRCYDCHVVDGVQFPPGEEPNQVMVKLGGEVERVQSYGELVTSVINPSHRLAQGYAAGMVAQDGKSKMTVYNDVMTVTQLTDIVAFLQAHYKLKPYEPTAYPEYYMP